MEEKPSASIKPYLDKLTLGVTRVLETSPGVAEVSFVEKEPAERHAIISWEQVLLCLLGYHMHLICYRSFTSVGIFRMATLRRNHITVVGSTSGDSVENKHCSDSGLKPFSNSLSNKMKKLFITYGH